MHTLTIARLELARASSISLSLLSLQYTRPAESLTASPKNRGHQGFTVDAIKLKLKAGRLTC